LGLRDWLRSGFNGGLDVKALWSPRNISRTVGASDLINCDAGCDRIAAYIKHRFPGLFFGVKALFSTFTAAVLASELEGRSRSTIKPALKLSSIDIEGKAILSCSIGSDHVQ
jgi:hypothetical protein